MSTEKRLVRYALTSKWTIMAALLMLAVAVAAELTGPFIAKTVIDRHISGIEEPWYETEAGSQAVSYNGAYYTREAYADSSQIEGEAVQIMQIGKSFYFTEEPLPLDGSRSFQDGELRIEAGETFIQRKRNRCRLPKCLRFIRRKSRLLSTGCCFT